MSPPDPDFTLEDRGGDAAIRFRGSTLEAALEGACRGFGALVADVDRSTVRESVPVEVDGDTPVEVAVSLLDRAVWHLDVDGRLVVGLQEATCRDGRQLRGRFRTVALGDVEVGGPVPKAATWHEARLEETDGGWEGLVVLDL